MTGVKIELYLFRHVPKIGLLMVPKLSDIRYFRYVPKITRPAYGYIETSKPSFTSKNILDRIYSVKNWNRKRKMSKYSASEDVWNSFVNVHVFYDASFIFPTNLFFTDVFPIFPTCGYPGQRYEDIWDQNYRSKTFDQRQVNSLNYRFFNFRLLENFFKKNK